MQNNSIKIFWFVYLFTLFFISPNVVQWALAVIVGGYGLIEGFNDAFKYFTISGDRFVLGFRLIPYVILGLIVIFMNKGKRAKLGIAWGGLCGIVFFIIWGYWVAQVPYYTTEHVSSTTAVALVFIPIYAVVSGLVGGVIGGIYTAFFYKRSGSKII